MRYLILSCISGLVLFSVGCTAAADGADAVVDAMAVTQAGYRHPDFPDPTQGMWIIGSW